MLLLVAIIGGLDGGCRRSRGTRVLPDRLMYHFIPIIAALEKYSGYGTTGLVQHDRNRADDVPQQRGYAFGPLDDVPALTMQWQNSRCLGLLRS